MERLHILDGYGYIFRAFYGLAGGGDRRNVRLTTAGGMPTGGLFVYARMLIRLHLDVRPERIVVVYDAPGPTFRSGLDPQYKATRSETPDDLKVQMPYFQPLTEAFAWPVVRVPGFEADDVIAALVDKARARDWDVTIYTGDKDMMQLVDEHVTCVDSLRQITYDIERVTKKFGVPPKQVRDWLAMVGDKSDNVPGMAGVGKVTATKLLSQFGDIDGILANTASLKGKMKQRFEDPEAIKQLLLSRKLVTLAREVDPGKALDELKPGEWDGERLRGLFEELEFQVLLETLEPQDKSVVVSGDARTAVEPIIVTRDNVEVIDEFVRAAAEAKKLGIYAEPDGLRADRAKPIGFGLATADSPPLYIPLEHRYLSAPKQVPAADLPTSLLELLADPSVEVFCHDAKAAIRTLRRVGIQLAGVTCDTMLAAYIDDSSSGNYGMERVVNGFGGVVLPPKKSLLGKGKNAISFESVLVEIAADYVGSAAVGIFHAADALRKRLAKAKLSHLHDELELPLAKLLADVEDIGIRIDVNFLRSLSAELGGQLAELEHKIFELAGGPINVGSPKQLGALLFDRLGLTSPKMKKTKGGAYSTDHEVLESLRNSHDIIPPILEYRELIKLKGTYIDALPPLVSPTTNRLHTSFNQAVAATGRLSSQDPNLQNIPVRTELGRRIRNAFIPDDGCSLVSADYSQIELRVLAHLSGDPVLTRAFNNDIDVHSQTAAEVFGIPLDEVGKHERRVAKAVNYGLVYGQSDFGLSRALDIPRAEAKHYIETYFRRFSGVADFMEEIVAKARLRSSAETILGRRRPIPDLTSSNYQRRQAAQRVAQNTPMQGSAADIMKLAMLRVGDMLRESSFDARCLLTVHDELVLEVPVDQAEELGNAVKTAMENAYQLKVPLCVDIGIASNWTDAH